MSFLTNRLIGLWYNFCTLTTLYYSFDTLFGLVCFVLKIQSQQKQNWLITIAPTFTLQLLC